MKTILLTYLLYYCRIEKKQCINSIDVKETVEGADSATIEIQDPEFRYINDDIFEEDNTELAEPLLLATVPVVEETALLPVSTEAPLISTCLLSLLIFEFLSGNYYVKDVTRQISSSGYSHSATLIRTDVGNSLKSSTTTTAKKPVQKPAAAEPSPQQASSSQRTYTVKVISISCTSSHSSSPQFLVHFFVCGL